MDYFINELDVSTGKVTKVPMTDEQIALQLALEEKAKLELQALAQKEAARQSALEKLAALGLTEAEIQALAG
jgi:hypothetical protein